jgi:hypothetical protein
MSLPALRQQLAALLAPPRAGDAAAIPTGIEALDRALSDGGVPGGRLTEIQGARGSGRTTLVRQIVTAAIAGQRWVAIVDGTRTLAPCEWAGAGASGRLWVIRPRSSDRSAWCADILLRSGAFSLVVLDGAPPLSRAVAVRLTRLAKEHDVALVIVGEGSAIGSAVRLRVKRARATHQSPITILIEKGGVQHAVEVSSAIEVARRLRSHPEVPDRRGVAKRNRWGKFVPSPNGQRPADDAVSHGAAPRQRRFGEAPSTRDKFILERRGKSRTQRTKRKAQGA